MLSLDITRSRWPRKTERLSPYRIGGHVLLQGDAVWSKECRGDVPQRATTALFHDMIHKEMEVYVDDMIAKSWA